MTATAGGTIRPCPPIDGWPQLYVRKQLVDEVEIATDDEPEGAPKDKRTLARGAARLICDENGQRLFDPKNEVDVALLGKQSWEMLQQVLAAAEGKPGN